MGPKLLVRAYNVGVGDCFYVRIPEGDDGFHILIDCGTKGGANLLAAAITHLKSEMLPGAGVEGKVRLDLLVVTHRHEDHIKGFDPDLFADIQVRNVWLSAAMDENHPQASKAQQLHAFAEAAMLGIESRGLAASTAAQLLASQYGVSNDTAMDTVKRAIPEQNGIQAQYVHAGMSAADLGLNVPETEIHVLGPEQDIDGYYLGEEADESLRSLQEIAVTISAASLLPAESTPQNISPADFRQLQAGLLSNALSFAELDSSIQNNVSVILLIVWRKRRLLFVGDAEWDGEFKEGKHNGSWNVMWHERRAHLQQPLDFLKIGHHGSINATPRRPDKDESYEVNQILNAILPLPAEGTPATATAIVSTERSYYDPIPEADLLAELGRRVANTRRYLSELNQIPGFVPEQAIHLFAEREAQWLDMPQPWRTDMEHLLNGSDYVDVELEPGE